MFSLRSEDLSGLGGPMGTERTSTKWIKYFKSLKSAKDYALKDYQREARLPGAAHEDMGWRARGDGVAVRSDDLGFVMYHIAPVKVED